MYGYEDYYGQSGYVPRVNSNQGQLAYPTGYPQYPQAPPPQPAPMYSLPSYPGMGQYIQQVGMPELPSTAPLDFYNQFQVPQARPGTFPPMHILEFNSPPEPAQTGRTVTGRAMPAPNSVQLPPAQKPAAKKAPAKTTKAARDSGGTAKTGSRSYSNRAASSGGGIRQTAPGSYTNAPLPARVAPVPARPRQEPDVYYGPIHVTNPRFQNPRVTPHRAPVDTRGEDY